MDGGDQVIRRRKSLTERLGLKGIGCCGSTWGIMPATSFNVVDDEDENDDVEVQSHHIHTPPETLSATTTCLAVGGGSSGMNLAAALAAERHFRADYDNDEINIHTGSRPSPNSNSGPLRPVESSQRNVPTHDNNEINLHSGPRPGSNSNSGLRPDESGSPGNMLGTPTRMSLMKLLEETEIYEGELLMEDEEVGVGSDSVCCVCMRRKKGAAFIPCGHTFCRVCSRELWVNRGCCPLCNRSILEILDIY
ncbi:uncharacterized protein LOC129895042 [Solanum dulcamara]|uniref:uncharacterized protein LOC129895042 n=1 Tax=Solanum dulcamara TaxID=45834 RepID=UPI0024858B75|nr:uncharacterized protein LOC129895042 [Solanum dulcamara]XP_055826646.1 uncharacterized protein LOC129895042 [Solanum dulcamara]XP_055826647.1 uncharacterized protein LOC129895042 [Solanum dulcamara]XP_055826648.1 uncharacterized protein LOC129895042 [Solanum dulcamara]XP_055826649.1 uncharacterized protein LOC129895042 [Solanum dulcamara]